MSEDNNVSLLGQDLGEEAQGSQYLTFFLNREHYGLSILQVQEIRGWESVTRVPNSPDYVKGVVNLRGTIVPVYDLRLRFGLPETAYTKETVVIVVRAGREGEERSMGLAVDAVSDVLVVKDEEIGNTPEFGSGVPTENIKGLVTDQDTMVMLLDLDSLAVTDRSSDEQDAA